MLKVIYSLFLGVILAVFVGVGISTFTGSPEYPDYPENLARLDTAELNEQQCPDDQARPSVREPNSSRLGTRPCFPNLLLHAGCRD